MPPAVVASPERGPASWLDLTEDAARVELPPIEGGELREAALATWRGRMVQEHGSAPVFEGLAAQLEAAGFPAAYVEACWRFAAEERRHGVLCGAVVEALGGHATADSRASSFVSHGDASSELEAALRSVMSVCCLSETVAVALIGAERLEMEAGPLRQLLSDIYGDEVGHARFGWHLLAQTLASFAPDERAALTARLEGYLSVAFAHLEAHELAHLPLSSEPPPEGAALGLCEGRRARQLFYATVEEVILPSLGALGFDATASWQRRSRHDHRWS